MKRSMKNLVWAALALAGATWVPAQGIQRIAAIPAEGLVLKGESTLEPARITGGYRILPMASSAKITPWKQLQSRPPKGTYRLDRQRRHERDKELGQRQGLTGLRGLATEFLYKRQRKRVERRR